MAKGAVNGVAEDDGTIARAFKKVSPKTHDDKILAALKDLTASE